MLESDAYLKVAQVMVDCTGVGEERRVKAEVWYS